MDVTGRPLFFPTSLGAPPQITTAALGDRTAHYIKANWSTLSA